MSGEPTKGELFSARAILRGLKSYQVTRLAELEMSGQYDHVIEAQKYFADRIVKIAGCLSVLETYDLDMWERLEKRVQVKPTELEPT